MAAQANAVQRPSFSWEAFQTAVNNQICVPGQVIRVETQRNFAFWGVYAGIQNQEGADTRLRFKAITIIDRQDHLDISVEDENNPVVDENNQQFVFGTISLKASDIARIGLMGQSFGAWRNQQAAQDAPLYFADTAQNEQMLDQALHQNHPEGN